MWPFIDPGQYPHCVEKNVGVDDNFVEASVNFWNFRLPTFVFPLYREHSAFVDGEDPRSDVELWWNPRVVSDD